MKRRWSLVVGVAAALSICSVVSAQVSGQTGGVQMLPQVTVTGQGEAHVAPDRAAITIGVQSRASTASAAGADNARKQRAIIDALRALGIPADQIGTQNFGVFPDMVYDPRTQQSRVAGYVVNNSVRVELKDLDLISRAIDASLAKGANQISSLEFHASNPDELRRRALVDAVARARADADALARAAGGSLGPLLELTSADVGGPPIIMRSMAQADAMAKVPTPIEPGTETLRVTVTARWQFVPAPR